jgi:hypothetical protein
MSRYIGPVASAMVGCASNGSVAARPNASNRHPQGLPHREWSDHDADQISRDTANHATPAPVNAVNHHARVDEREGRRQTPRMAAEPPDTVRKTRGSPSQRRDRPDRWGAEHVGQAS